MVKIFTDSNNFDRAKYGESYTVKYKDVSGQDKECNYYTASKGRSDQVLNKFKKEFPKEKYTMIIGVFYN